MKKIDNYNFKSKGLEYQEGIGERAFLMRHKRAPRILHGMVNIAGKGRYLADWQRKHMGAISDFVVFLDFGTFNNSHYNLHIEQLGIIGKAFCGLLFFLSSLLHYDVFHFYFGSSLLPLNLDLPVLRLFRKKIIMTYCGSEVRLAAIERAHNPFVPLWKSGLDNPKYDKRKKIRLRWHSIWCHQITAFRGLHDSVSSIVPSGKLSPHALWINNTVTGSFSPVTFSEGTDPVKIVHAPTNQSIKGTEYIESAIEKLKNSGINLVYRRLEGMSHHDVMEEVKSADIVIDQLLLGDFGNVSVEGMFHGKVVVCYISPRLFELYPDCPIISATIEDVDLVLQELTYKRDAWHEIGGQGQEFVRKYASREKVYKKAWELYGIEVKS